MQDWNNFFTCGKVVYFSSSPKIVVKDEGQFGNVATHG